MTETSITTEAFPRSSLDKDGELVSSRRAGPRGD